MEPRHSLMEMPEERLRKEIEFYNQQVIDRNGRTHDTMGRFQIETENLETEPEPSLLDKMESYGLLYSDFKRVGVGTYKRVTRLGVVAWDIIIILGIAYVIHVIFR